MSAPQSRESYLTESEDIAAGQRVHQFLEDEVIKRALARLAAKYFEEFKRAATPAARESVWAKARALEDIENELRVLHSNGEIAKRNREARDAQEAAKQRPRR